MLHMYYSLSYGHHGTIPCSPDHRKADGLVGATVDRVQSFVITGTGSVRTARGPVRGPSRGQRGANISRDLETLDLCKALLYGHSQGCRQ